MPGVWNAHSIEVLGYVAPITYTNDLYVSTHIVQKWLDSGKTLNQILLAWNAGPNAKKCGSGTNKFGVKYNSCEYVKKGVVAFNSN